MGTGLVAENSFHSIMPEESFGEKQIDSHNITVILPAYNEEVSIGSVGLLARQYADRTDEFYKKG